MRIFPDGTVAGEVEEVGVVSVCLPAEADEEPEEAGGRVSVVPLEAPVEEAFPSLLAEEVEEGKFPPSVPVDESEGADPEDEEEREPVSPIGGEKVFIPTARHKRVARPASPVSRTARCVMGRISFPVKYRLERTRECSLSIKDSAVPRQHAIAGKTELCCRSPCFADRGIFY